MLIEPQTIALIILGPLAVLYMLKHLMAWFHNRKSRIDEFQKTVARGAGICRQAQLPMLSEILVNAAALDYDDGILAIKTAIHSVDEVPKLLEALRANLIWQIDHRAKTDEGVELVADAVLANPAIMASILAGLEAAKEEAVYDAALTEAKNQIAPAAPVAAPVAVPVIPGV